MRRSASPVIVVVALTLAAAVAGTALAGPGTEANTSASAKKTAKKALKLAKQNKKSIKNIELIAGPKGVTGDDGSPNAATLITGRLDPVPAIGETAYWPPSGQSSGAGESTETDATTLAPNRALIARDLAVEVDTAPSGGATETIDFTLRVNQAPGLTCQIAGAASTCNSGGQSVTIPAGADLAIEVETGSGGSGAASRAQFGWRPAASQD